jgi:hypothetical protein
MNHIHTEVRTDGSIEPVFDIVTTTRHWPHWHPATKRSQG